MSAYISVINVLETSFMFALHGLPGSGRTNIGVVSWTVLRNYPRETVYTGTQNVDDAWMVGTPYITVTNLERDEWYIILCDYTYPGGSDHYEDVVQTAASPDLYPPNPPILTATSTSTSITAYAEGQPGDTISEVLPFYFYLYDASDPSPSGLIESSGLSESPYTFRSTLTPDTAYSVAAQVRNEEGASQPSAIIVRTKGGSVVKIYTEKNGVKDWYPATPYIYDSGQWKRATAKIYDSGSWRPV